MPEKNSKHPGLDGFSPMQAKFVKEYVKDLDGPAAAIRAGYSKKSVTHKASDLLHDPRVRQQIDIELAKLYVRHEGDSSEFIISKIHEIVSRCMQHEPVLDRHGEPVLVKTPSGMLRAAYKFNSGGALEGLKLLGKHSGMFEDEKGTNVAVTVNIRRFGTEVKVTAKEPKDITPKPKQIEQPVEKETEGRDIE